MGNKKYNTEEFIEKAQLVHGDKYDYSQVNYISSKSKINIICHEHGVFEQRASSHLMGYGCNNIEHKYKTNLGFIEEAKKIHGDKYDYSKVLYVGIFDKIDIICPIHNIFKQRPNDHLNGNGCPKCVNKHVTTKEFIEKAKLVHGDKYDYSLVNYINNINNIKIICPEHGEYEQTPNSHLNGNNCSKCSGKYMDTKYFIEKAKKIHSDKYDYSLVNYINNITNIKIICQEHGAYKQLPNNHLRGANCPKCSSRFINTDYFINKANFIHENKYDYSLTKYSGALEKIEIICNKHGIFNQIASVHLSGCGCPQCYESKGETAIVKYLSKNNINFIREKKFDNCKNKRYLPFDFYLPDYNLLIEYDGKQHFESINYFGGDDAFIKRKNNDEIKNKFCIDNNIPLLRIKYDEINNINEILNKHIQWETT